LRSVTEKPKIGIFAITENYGKNSLKSIFFLKSSKNLHYGPISQKIFSNMPFWNASIGINTTALVFWVSNF
jgi:hypothetical protein